jgi:hypothetical protein
MVDRNKYEQNFRDCRDLRYSKNKSKFMWLEFQQERQKHRTEESVCVIFA